MLLTLQVAEGDIVEVNEVLEEVGEEGSTKKIRRGRVIVQEIGSRTRCGGYHLTLTRYKHYAIFHRNLCTIATHLDPFIETIVQHSH